MKTLIVAVALVVSASTWAATPMTPIERECDLQTNVIGEIYLLYRQGASKEYTKSYIPHPEASRATRAWVSRITDEIFGDSRSMYVDLALTQVRYLDACIADPQGYIRDKDLLR